MLKSWLWKSEFNSPTWDQIFKPITMLVTNFEHVYRYTYTWAIYQQSMKKIEGPIWYSVPPHPIPSHQTRRFAPRCVNLFGPRRESVPAWSILLPHSFGRLRRHFLLKNHISSNLWNFQIFIKISKKGLWPSVFLKNLTFSTFLKKSCWNCDF